MIFVACQMIYCQPIPIIDDLAIESNKSFGVTLGRSLDMDPRLIINTTTGIIIINDDDSTFISGDAHINTVNLCIFISTISCHCTYRGNGLPSLRGCR